MSQLGKLPAVSLVVAAAFGVIVGIIGTLFATDFAKCQSLAIGQESRRVMQIKGEFDHLVRQHAELQVEFTKLQASRTSQSSATAVSLRKQEPVVTSVDVPSDFRARLSLVHSTMKTRGELPGLLARLGLVGEGVEVGVRDGAFSKHVLNNWQCSRWHMVDPWAYQDEKLYKDVSNRDQAHQDGLYTALKNWLDRYHPNRYQLHRDYSVNAAKKFAPNSLDFVYLDARHDFAGVAEDLEAWYPKLKPGGLIAGHDFVPDGLLKEGRFGVQGAVHKFATRVGKEVQSISSKDPHGGRQEPQRFDGGWTTWYFIK